MERDGTYQDEGFTILNDFCTDSLCFEDPMFCIAMA